MSWGELERENPGLVDFGAERFEGGVAYLATTRKDGSPRVYPVTPIIGEGHLFLFMEPTSPKTHDLRRDGRYAIHSAVSDSSGSNGEFFVSGRAQLVEDAHRRALAIRFSNFEPEDRYVLFEFDLKRASSTVYEEGRPMRKRWTSDTTDGS